MSDSISRQKVIDTIDKYISGFDAIDANFLDGLKTSKKLIKELPSAQTEIVRCKDCVWNRVCRFRQYLGLDGYCSRGERQDG